jgi:hypothetical protein
MTYDLIVMAWGTLLGILHVYGTKFKDQRPLSKNEWKNSHSRFSRLLWYLRFQCPIHCSPPTDLSFYLPLGFLSGLVPSGSPSAKSNGSLQEGATCLEVSVWSL